MELIIAKSAGFCFGVDRAVSTVYDKLTNQKIYTYGPIIHNTEVIKDLENKGVKIIDDINELKEDGLVIIRSHGAEKYVYSYLDNNNLKYVDCTCPFVKKIHNIVKDSYESKNTIIIIGDRNHPEIIGINSWCNNEGIIINSIEEAQDLIFEMKPYVIVSQTTFSSHKFEQIVEILKTKITSSLKVYNTICNATETRQKEASEIASNVNIMLVIGDKKSSNTQKLYDICKLNCKKTYYIETIKDLQLNIFKTNDKIGITAGASTPSAIIKEVIKTMNELDNESFEQMLDNSFVTLHNGQIVKGTVIQIANDEVSVCLNYKSDGIILKNEFSSNPNLKPSDVLKVGDEIEVYVMRVNDGEGNVLLSRKRVEAKQNLDKIETAYKNKQSIKGKFVEIIKGGMIASIDGVSVFVPLSQVSNKYVEDLTPFLNQEYDFNIIEFNKQKRKFIAGRKKLIQDELNKKREEVFESVEKGQIINGTVTRITAFGAFVDLGGIDGLIHISEMSWSRVDKPQDILKEGQTVEAIVLTADKEKGKISLSLKIPENNPWNHVAEKYSIGSIIEGKVVRILPFGAFVEIEPGIDGLIYISQISTKHIAKPEDELSVGQTVKVKILDIDIEAKKISLSKKEADGIINEAKVDKPSEDENGSSLE